MAEKKQALDGKRFNGFFVDPHDVVIVGLDCPVTDELVHLYDKTCHNPPDEGTVRNIMRYGVVEPAIVTKIGPDAFILDGRCRTICLREGNRRLEEEGKQTWLLPVVTRKGSEHELFGISVSANNIRKVEDQMNKAERAGTMMYNMGMDPVEISIAFDVTVTTIHEWMKLLDLAPSVKNMVRSGELSAHAASKLHKLPVEEQVAKAKEAIEEAQASGKKRPTGRSMTKKADDTTTLTPPKRLIQSIVTMDNRPEIKPEHDNFWSALRFMMGELSLEDVGLDETAKAILDAKVQDKAQKEAKREQKKAERAQRKAEREQKKAERAQRKAEREQKKAEKEATPATESTKPTIAKKKGASKSEAA